jgi:hypothetical protein
VTVIEELKAVISSVMPREIVQPWLDGGRGVELVESSVRVFERLYRDWITNGINKCYYLLANRGAYSLGTLTFTIDTAADVVLAAESTFKAADGRRYLSVGPVLVESPQSTVEIPVRGRYKGPAWDSDEDVEYEPVLIHWTDPITEDPCAGPTNGDFDFVSATEASGGEMALLDMLAANRGVVPSRDESTTSLRNRTWGRLRAIVMADLRDLAEELFWDSLWDGIALEPPYGDVYIHGPREQGCMVGSPTSDEPAVGQAFASAPPPMIRVFMPDLPDDEATDEDGESYLLRTVSYQATAQAVRDRVAGGVTAFFYRGTPPLEE